MKIFLLDCNNSIIESWSHYFKDIPNVVIINDDFKDFMDNNDVSCIVSPGNAYGLMDGGYDLAISEWFGWELMRTVQSVILKRYRGEQPVGTSIIVDTGIKDIKLIHTPTMRVPSRIIDASIVYQCMRTCLITAIDNSIQSIVIPAFGGGCGAVPASLIGSLMYNAYAQIMNPPSELNWEYAKHWCQINLKQ